MSSFLDKMPPFNFADPAARDLWTLLSDNYQSKPPVRDMLLQVHVSTAEIDWDKAMRWVWADILQLTHRQAKLRPLLEQIAASGDEAIAVRIKELTAASPVSSAPQPDPKTMTWKGFGDHGLEKVIQAQPTFLDIAFLRRGTELGAAVCRLLVTLSGTQYNGTAFRIGQDLLLTNHHVLFDEEHENAMATTVEAWFGYERTLTGLDLAYMVVACDPATIVGDSAHDWATIKVTKAMPAEAPAIELRGAAPVKADDRVYIIQHPGGAPKKIGMIHNVVRYVDDQVVQYLTDTEGGSSGSPVFNEKWQLVALHHQWVEVTAGGVTEIRNQGQRIERVVESMQTAKVI
ncbi:MAG: serine protease [Streptosporangiaceae bacterium]|jgi:endonuclease G